MNRRQALTAFFGGMVGGIVATFIRKERNDRISLSLKVDDGRIENCYIEPRDDQEGYMFETNSKGSLVPNLKGYAIIPIEKWEQLTGRTF